MGQTADSNRTIQIDALTDVQLLAPDVETPSAAPPPLPRRPPAPSRARTIVLTALASLAGLIVALLAMHYLFPTPAPTPSTTTHAVRHIQLDDELVIRAGDSTP